MKKTFLTIALGLATITFAQQKEMDKSGKMNPEQRKVEMQKRQQEHLDKMSKDLNLSQDQIKKIKDLQDKQIADVKKNLKKNKEERNDRMQEMKKKQEAHAAEMKKILSEDQFKKWEADRKNKMERSKEMMKDKKGKMGKRKMKDQKETPMVD